MPREWSKILEDGFDHEVWQRLVPHCRGCGLCAYVCPSCSCFDMNHEVNSWCGEQCRSWDACTFAGFTRHASGHNPRGSKQARYRQRVLHKFAFREREEDPFRCTGCGRCVALCPAGVDIVDTANAAAESSSASRARDGSVFASIANSRLRATRSGPTRWWELSCSHDTKPG